MKKTGFSFTSISIMLLIIGVCTLLYISLLGENNKTTVLVEYYLQSIKEKEYGDIERLYSQKAKNTYGNFDDATLFHFVLELSLLKRYGLLDEEDYLIKATRQSLWIPYVGPDRVDVSVSLHKKNQDNAMKRFLAGGEPHAITGLVTVVRESGAWRIDSINISTSSIANDFEQLKQGLHFNKYVEIVDNGFVLKQGVINLKQVSPVEKRLIAFSLQKALESFADVTP